MNNYLKLYRKKLNLAQNDIAFLLGMTDSSLLSKIESGKRPPNLDTIICYELLSQASLSDVYPKRYTSMKRRIVDGIELLIPLLEDEYAQFEKERIESLRSIQKRLMSELEG